MEGSPLLQPLSRDIDVAAITESGRLARALRMPEQVSRALSRNDVSLALIELNSFACHTVGRVQLAGRQEDACEHHPCVAAQIELVGVIRELHGLLGQIVRANRISPPD